VALEWRCQPAISLLSFGDVALVKAKLAGLDAAAIVFVRNDEHGHFVFARLPQLDDAVSVLPEPGYADDAGV